MLLSSPLQSYSPGGVYDGVTGEPMITSECDVTVSGYSCDKAEGKRDDGRKPNQFRAVSINSGVMCRADVTCTLYMYSHSPECYS